MEYIEKLKKKYSESDDGISLSVIVKPNSSTNNITGVMDNGVIKISIVAIPEKGKANKEIVKFISKVFSVPKYNIEIIKGLNNSKKIIKLLK